MKLGEVIAKERVRASRRTEEMAGALGISVPEYEALERGETPAERWGPILAQLAVKLAVPTSRLVADSGRSADYQAGNCGKLIREQRERKQLTTEQLAELLALPAAELAAIEAGQSELEVWAPRFLRCAELVEQPVFNFFYPCGLPFESLTDYP
jgi:transcriptional regulator with XRE-family HTH domain